MTFFLPTDAAVFRKERPHPHDVGRAMEAGLAAFATELRAEERRHREERKRRADKADPSSATSSSDLNPTSATPTPDNLSTSPQEA